MKHVITFFRKEWKSLLTVIFFVSLYGYLTTGHSDSREIQANIHYDDMYDRWFFNDGHKAIELEDHFVSVDVLWRGTVKGNPVILVEGHQVGECKNTYVVYWLRFNGTVENFKSFDTCNANSVDVTVKDNDLQIQLDRRFTSIEID